MDLDLRERERDGELRCPYCLDDVQEHEEQPCEGCGVVVHTECHTELGGCPTLGCARAAKGPLPAPLGANALRIRPRRPTPRRPRVRCYGCSERLGDGYELCPGCGWAFHPRCAATRACCALGEAEAPATPSEREPSAGAPQLRRLPALVLALAILVVGVAALLVAYLSLLIG